MMLSEFPLVESPTAISPALANAASWRANTTSNPMSFARAVTTAISLVSEKKGGSLACVHPTRRRSAKAQNKAEAAGHHMAPPRHADSLAPDYGQGRPLRLRAGGRPRLATAPHSRGPARGALRFSGPVLGRRPSALFALAGSGCPVRGWRNT